MRYLLDTHALLWARSAPHRLSPAALAILNSADNLIYVSMASLWEVRDQVIHRKLVVPGDFYRIVAADYEILRIDLAHVEACAKLPMHHRDPFDRLLVVQAQIGGLVLATRDQNIAKYDVPVLKA